MSLYFGSIENLTIRIVSGLAVEVSYLRLCIVHQITEAPFITPHVFVHFYGQKFKSSKEYVMERGVWICVTTKKIETVESSQRGPRWIANRGSSDTVVAALYRTRKTLGYLHTLE